MRVADWRLEGLPLEHAKKGSRNSVKVPAAAASQKVIEWIVVANLSGVQVGTQGVLAEVGREDRVKAGRPSREPLARWRLVEEV